MEVEINKCKIPFDKSIFENVISNLECKYAFIFEDDYLEKCNEEEDNKEKIEKDEIELLLNVLKEYIKNIDKKNKDIADILVDNKLKSILITDFFTELITELRLRYKYENFEINNSNFRIPTRFFNDIIHSGELIIRYKDLNENEYDPLKIPLNINDHRSKFEGFKINFQINIREIIDNTIIDVEKVG